MASRRCCICSTLQCAICVVTFENLVWCYECYLHRDDDDDESEDAAQQTPVSLLVRLPTMPPATPPAGHFWWCSPYWEAYFSDWNDRDMVDALANINNTMFPRQSRPKQRTHTGKRGKTKKHRRRH